MILYSIDIGLAGGISKFINGVYQDSIDMPVNKIEVKKARYKFDLLNGKKQFYKSGSQKGQPKMKQVSPAEYRTELDLFKIMEIFKESADKNENIFVIFESPAKSIGNSARTTATTNRNFGKLLATAELSGAEFDSVVPSKWKKDLSLTKDKKECVEFAEKEFKRSFRTKGGRLLDGQAESALIGKWFIDFYNK